MRCLFWWWTVLFTDDRYSFGLQFGLSLDIGNCLAQQFWRLLSVICFYWGHSYNKNEWQLVFLLLIHCLIYVFNVNFSGQFFYIRFSLRFFFYLWPLTCTCFYLYYLYVRPCCQTHLYTWHCPPQYLLDSISSPWNSLLPEGLTHQENVLVWYMLLVPFLILLVEVNTHKQPLLPFWTSGLLLWLSWMKKLDIWCHQLNIVLLVTSGRLPMS